MKESLKNTLRQILHTLNRPMLCTKKIDYGTKTIAGGGMTYFNATTLAVSNAPSGYSLVGLVGYTSGNGTNAAMTTTRLAESTYDIEIRNLSSASITIKPTVTALYARTELFEAL